MKNKEVKARRINNPDLLKLNWLEEFTGEQKFHQESDILPPQTEDAVVFFNACSITQVGRKAAFTSLWVVHQTYNYQSEVALYYCTWYG